MSRMSQPRLSDCPFLSVTSRVTLLHDLGLSKKGKPESKAFDMQKPSVCAAVVHSSVSCSCPVCPPVCVPVCLTDHVSPVRGQRLKEVLHLHEFRRESSELEDWMNEQRQTAESQDLGNDYQHVQVRLY